MPAAIAATVDQSSSPAAGPATVAPGGIDTRGATPSIALAQIQVPTQSAAPVAQESSALEVSGLETIGERSGLDTIAETGGEQVVFAEPSAGLGDIMAMREQMSAVPMLDTRGPAMLAMPPSREGADSFRSAALPSGIGGTPGGAPGAAPGAAPTGPLGQGPGAAQETGEAPESFEMASLPSQDLACVVPPSVTLDLRSAGETDVIIASPCHADTVATVTYHGITVGVKIDRGGQAVATMYGFATSTEVELAFDDGEVVSFDAPFQGVDRIERVAVAYDDPVSLNLHALEFGAEVGGDAHVHPGNPRDFRAVRRRGGGYLTTMKPVEGVGQTLQVYTHFVRRGGTTGVVRMYLDFASRDVDRLPAACGTGAFARPAFEVLRASRGREERPNPGRLAPVACDDVGNADTLIGAAVRDIIISQR
ncbi:MAG: hypothetical protein AAF677_13525 [Pseudomonadota bacterium]